MKVGEVASLVVFLFIALSFLAANHNNKAENERIAADTTDIARGVQP